MIHQNYNNAKTITRLIILVGIIGMLIFAVYTIGNLGETLADVPVTTIFILGLIWLIVGILLWIWLARNKPQTRSQPAIRAMETKRIDEMERVKKATGPLTPPTKTPADAMAKSASAPVSDSTPDDLTVIEGIGPKSRDALHSAGITTFAQLADSTQAELDRIVKVEHKVKIIGDTETWAKQAAFLVDGDMGGLKKYQDYLIGGREPNKPNPPED